MKKQITFFKTAIIFMAFSFLTTTSAAVRTFQFTGTITSGGSGTFVATLSYDDSQSPTYTTNGRADYGSYSFTLVINGTNTYYSSPGGVLQVLNSFSDLFRLVVTVDGYAGFNLGDISGTVFNSTSLPASLPLNSFDEALIYVSVPNIRGNIITITEVTPESLIDDLQSFVVGLGLPNGLENSLTSSLNNAKNSLQNGNNGAAINQLEAFINKVEAQRGKKIDESDANELIADGEAIIELIQSGLEKSNSGESLASSDITPQSYSLDQNFPNPFNPSTVIRYAVPDNAKVTLVIYDVLGNQIVELVNGTVSAGYHEVSFDGSSLASGIYFYRLSAGSFTQINKMILMK